MKIKGKNKQAISLILLVITVIVMIILAGAIILTLSNVGIIEQAEKAVDDNDFKEVQTIASLAWSEAYMEIEGRKTQEKLEEKVLEKLRAEDIEIAKYKITVTKEGVEVTQNPWVIASVDGVPIPKGFVASQYAGTETEPGENTKDGGLVIYEGTVPVTKDNIDEARRTRNQYVWVPVEDFSDFVRKNFGLSNTISNELGNKYWEVELDLTTNMPLDTQDSAYMTKTTLDEVQLMYESVKEYKGFYIARYEAGLDIEDRKTSDDGEIKTVVYSMMNKAPYNYVRWTYNNVMDEDTNGAVEVARSIYPKTNTNYGVVSTLTYGVQWDRTLAWWVETKATNGTGDVTIDSNAKLRDSRDFGNYRYNAIANSTFNSGASVSRGYGETYTTIDSSYAKEIGQEHLLTTGATEEARVNNIYDMAGNLHEWTMEGRITHCHVVRGDRFVNWDEYSVVSRSDYDPDEAYGSFGFRPALYIKMN